MKRRQRESLRDGTVVVTEIESRTDGRVRYRRWVDDQLVERRRATEEEREELREFAAQRMKNRAHMVRDEVLARVVKGAPANDLVTLLVSLNIIPVREAVEAGWDPPNPLGDVDRGPWNGESRPSTGEPGGGDNGG